MATAASKGHPANLCLISAGLKKKNASILKSEPSELIEQSLNKITNTGTYILMRYTTWLQRRINEYLRHAKATGLQSIHPGWWRSLWLIQLELGGFCWENNVRYFFISVSNFLFPSTTSTFALYGSLFCFRPVTLPLSPLHLASPALPPLLHCFDLSHTPPTPTAVCLSVQALWALAHIHTQTHAHFQQLKLFSSEISGDC